MDSPMLVSKAGSVNWRRAGRARYSSGSLKEAAQGSQMPWETGPGPSLMMAPHQAQMSFTLPRTVSGREELPSAVADSVTVPLQT